MFAVEAHNLAKSCTKQSLRENKLNKMCYHMQTGNHNNMIDSKLPLPPT